jgi:hypothetical protein
MFDMLQLVVVMRKVHGKSQLLGAIHLMAPA